MFEDKVEIGENSLKFTFVAAVNHLANAIKSRSEFQNVEVMSSVRGDCEINDTSQIIAIEDVYLLPLFLNLWKGLTELTSSTERMHSVSVEVLPEYFFINFVKAEDHVTIECPDFSDGIIKSDLAELRTIIIVLEKVVTALEHEYGPKVWSFAGMKN